MAAKKAPAKKENEVIVRAPEDLVCEIEANRENGWVKYPIHLKMFAMEFLKDYDHVRAAKEVKNVNEKEGLSLIRDPIMQAFISDLQAETTLHSVITTDFVTTMWLRLLPKLMGDEEIAIFDKDGQSFGKNFFPAATVAAMRELGKSTKFYADGSGDGQPATNNLNIGIVGGGGAPPVINVHFTDSKDGKPVTIEQK